MKGLFMKRRHFAGIFALALAAAVAGSSLVTGTVALADDHEKMEEAMDVINTGHKKLKKSVTVAAENKASIGMLREMMQSAMVAKTLTPERAGQTPEAQRAKFIAEYQKAMNGLILDLINIENALLDGNNAEAEKLVKKLDQVKKTSHEAFQVQ